MIYFLFYSLLLCLLCNGTTLPDFHGKQKRSMLEDDPCLDAMQVESLDSVELLPRYAHLQRPWLRTGITPKIFTSDGLRYQWMWAKSLAVRGLGHGITIDDLLRFLDGQNCSFLAVGDAVWQSVQRSRPVRIEGEISCSMKELYTICLKKYGAPACSLFPSEIGGPTMYSLEIGDARANRSLDELKAEPLVLYEWGSTLSLPPSRWGYTVTTMAIHDNNAGQVYLIDMTGRGYMDTCGKSLAAAVEESQWKEWADEDVSKAYRFYLLRLQGFGVSNHELHNFVNRIIEKKQSKKAAQTFYCESVLNGVVSWAGDDLTTTCHLVYPSVTDRKRIAAAREVLSSEMGSHWSGVMGPAIDEMEAVYLTEKQFVDVRNRLKGRVSGDLVLADVSHGVLSPGEPLVNDMAEVHRRPIMSKAETVSELPKDVKELAEMDYSEENDVDTPVGAGFNDQASSTEDAHIPKRDITKVSSLEIGEISGTESPEEKLGQEGSAVPSSTETVLAEKNADSNSAPQHSSSTSVLKMCSSILILRLLASSIEYRLL